MRAFIVKDDRLIKELQPVKVSRDLHDRDYIEFMEESDNDGPYRIGHAFNPNGTFNKVIVPVIDFIANGGRWDEMRERVLSFDSEKQRDSIRH